MSNTSRRGHGGFTLIELLIVVTIVSILSLSAVPLVADNVKKARRTEAESMLGMFRTSARMVFAETGSTPGQLHGAVDEGGCGLRMDQLTGNYYRVWTPIYPPIRVEGWDVNIIAQYPAVNPVQEYGAVGFNWASGQGQFRHYIPGG